MNQDTLKKEAERIFDLNQLGTLATVKDGKPHSRYMTFFNDDFTLYTATNPNTHKVIDIEQNPNVHILLGYTYEGTEDKYLEIEGQAEFEDTPELKEKVWNDKLKPWFNGPDDPNYSILKIKPSEIRLMNTNDDEAQRITFH